MESYIKNIFTNSKQFESYDDIFITFKENGVNLDITGFTFTMDFRKGSKDGVLVLELSLTPGQLEIVDQSGVKKLKINSFSIPEHGDIFYDLRMKYPSTDKIKYYIGGKVKIEPIVTKQDN